MCPLSTYFLALLNVIFITCLYHLKTPPSVHKWLIDPKPSNPTQDKLALAFRTSQIEILSHHAENAAQLSSQATVAFLRKLSQISKPKGLNELVLLQSVIQLFARQDDIEDIGAIYNLYNAIPSLGHIDGSICQGAEFRLACIVRLMNGVGGGRWIVKPSCLSPLQPWHLPYFMLTYDGLGPRWEEWMEANVLRSLNEAQRSACATEIVRTAVSVVANEFLRGGKNGERLLSRPLINKTVLENLYVIGAEFDWKLDETFKNLESVNETVTLKDWSTHPDQYIPSCTNVAQL
jgi:hypothetical protein